VIRMQEALSRTSRLFGIHHDAIGWSCLINVFESLDQGYWMIQSMTENGVECPTPDGSRRDDQVFALFARMCEIGLRGRVDPDELTAWERLVDWEPLNPADGDQQRGSFWLGGIDYGQARSTLGLTRRKRVWPSPSAARTTRADALGVTPWGATSMILSGGSSYSASPRSSSEPNRG
jgi:hypothetical protein